MYRIDKVATPEQLDKLRSLLYEYGVTRNFDAALGDYQKELAELPGKYAVPAGCLLLATYQDQAVGCIAYQQLNTEYCEMKRLYVQKQHRGQGLAHRLVTRLIAEAQAAGYRYMRLDTHPTMLAAQALYQSFGFQEIERYNNNPIAGIRFFERAL